MGLAVSGGADSLALLLLADATLPGRFEVATVDHRLREGSAGEAARVARVCAAHGIRHRTLNIDVARSGNLQAQARAARYAALAAWAAECGCEAVATAHHLDDQAETLLMRLVRGAGVRGLAAMRPRAPLPSAPGTLLLRPLLGWRRAELARFTAEAGIEPVRDPGNADPRFARARVRRQLEQATWLPPEQLAASAGHLADADEALCWATAREWDEHVEALPSGWLYRPHAPRAIRLRVLERLLLAAGSAKPPRGPELARLLAVLEAGGTATLAEMRCSVDLAGTWRVVPAPPRKGG